VGKSKKIPSFQKMESLIQLNNFICKEKGMASLPMPKRLRAGRPWAELSEVMSSLNLAKH